MPRAGRIPGQHGGVAGPSPAHPTRGTAAMRAVSRRQLGASRVPSRRRRPGVRWSTAVLQRASAYFCLSLSHNCPCPVDWLYHVGTRWQEACRMARAARDGAAADQAAQVLSAASLERRRLGTPEAAVMRGGDNTRPAAGPGPGPDELTGRGFRALYPEFGLRTVGGNHVAVPRGTAWVGGPRRG